MLRKLAFTIIAVAVFSISANAQKAEVAVSLSEPFFDALLDSVFQNFDPPQFSIAQNQVKRRDQETLSITKDVSNHNALSFAGDDRGSNRPVCNETIKILREINGVRTSVRFREGKIYVPLAFSGDYAPPFVGCVEFSGWAEANIDLEFDQAGQRLIGRARVLNVNLSGTGGVGGTLIAKLLQGSIDKKLNPIEIMRLDKVSFGLPVPNAGNIRMKATGVRPEIVNGLLQIHISYDFLKG